MSSRFVTDTHALLWHLEGRTRKLGRRARRILADTEEGKARVAVPVVVLVEVLDALRLGRIQLEDGFRAWVERLSSHPGYVVADLTTEVVLRSAELLSIPDRADRLIAATALHLDATLITRDPAIGEAGVATVW